MATTSKISHSCRLAHYFLPVFFLLTAACFATETDDWLKVVFEAKKAKAGAVWVKEKLKEELRKAIGSAPSTLRIRYWQLGERRAWLLTEVGNEEPITAGFVIHKGKIESVSVLEYNDSRGEDIRKESFTKQFEGMQLNEKDELSGQVDGISGATQSVWAMERMANWALWLDQYKVDQ